jgi:hypothetical protein
LLPAPDLDGKEGVDGSSPSEGFTKGQPMAFFLASRAYVHRSSIPHVKRSRKVHQFAQSKSAPVA